MTAPLMTNTPTSTPAADVPVLAATRAAILATATTATPTTKRERPAARQVRQWVAGVQDAAWLARCRELAETGGLTHAAQWRHIASEETGEEDGDQEHELVVPSGSYSDILYTVRARAQQLTDTAATYTFRCGCEGHSWGAPCRHVGAALVKLEARDKAMAEAMRETSSVMDTWARGFEW